MTMRSASTLATERPFSFSPSRVSALVVLIGAVLALACVAGLDEPAARFAASHLQRYRTITRLFTDLGLSGYMLVGSAAVAGVAIWLRGRETIPGLRRDLEGLRDQAVFVFTTVAASGILAQLLKHGIGRARPKLIDTLGVAHFDLFSVKASLASFPSGHTTSAFALVSALILLGPRVGWWLAPVAVAVGLSRWAVGAHYPSDVVAGAVLGTVVTLGLSALSASRGRIFERCGYGLALRDGDLVGRVLRTYRERFRSGAR